MSAWSFYISTLVVYFAVDMLSGVSINLQYGYAGVVNLAYIVFQSAGAYIAAATTLGPDSGAGAFQSYVFGANLPYPVSLVLATLGGAVLAGFVGLFSLRRMRRDYQGAVLLIVSLVALQVVTADVPLFNGSNGLTGVPKPFGSLNLSLQGYQWAYAGWSMVIAAAVYLVVRRLSRSHWGNGLRAMRDQEDAASVIGLNTTVMRMQVFVIGGAIAGLSGGLLVQYIGAWSPGAWGYAETFVIFTAIFVGGLGNYRGVILGIFLVPTLFLELPQFLPQIGYPGLIDSLEWIAIGLMWTLCLYFRPQGFLPERKNVALGVPLVTVEEQPALVGAGGRR
ncbi:MAG TPA: branched-chain amino acid ABC transporter permease [Acidimicrobiales bacterium]|nr:branched-chain amino acid ABC transporter permease [Acidimicrobiales bacterium]